MSKRLAFALPVLFMISASTAVCQDVKGAEGKGSAAATYEVRRREALDKLKSIKVGLGDCGEGFNRSYDSASNSYADGGDICFGVAFTNGSSDPVSFPVTDLFQQARPQLFKDGEPVPYREKVAALLEEKEKSQEIFSVKVVTLAPGQTTSLRIHLGDWYEPLRDGSYSFSVKWRFVYGGDWVESPPADFKVRSK